MPDYGARMADRKIKTIDRRLRFTYHTAERELKEKLADFNKKFAEKDKKKQKQLADGEITKDEYKAWLNGQVFIRSQWEDKIHECQQVMFTHNKQAMNIVHNNSIDVFAENYNYQAFIAEQTTGISFGIYNTEAVASLIKDNPDILPEWKIDEEKDYTWNEKKVNNCVRQGIIQGESINQITDRLCISLATMNENRMRMFARTAITGAQNAGRQQQMEDAAELGIEQNKRWLATMDRRTRDAHRHLDGQEVPYNEPFESDLGEIEYPGDPSADPANVYNCRCTMETIYPKYENYNNRNPRRAYGEYEDENGETRRFSYLTTDPEAYQKWRRDKAVEQSKQTGIRTITDKFMENAIPGIGSMKYEKGFKEKAENLRERETAKWLLDNIGGNITLLKKVEKDSVKTPDYRWRGKLWDLKSTTTTKACKSAVKHGIEQIKQNAGGIILNYGNNEFDLDQVVRYADMELKGKDLNCVILIISNDKLVLAREYKK